MTPGKLLEYYSGVEFTRELIENSTSLTQQEKDQVITWGYGHLGDGDIHINLVVPGENKELLDKVNSLV